MKKEERELRKMQVRLNNKEKQEELKVESEHLDSVLTLISNSMTRSTVQIRAGEAALIVVKLFGLLLLLLSNSIKYIVTAKIEEIRTGDDINAYSRFVSDYRQYTVKCYLTSQPMIAGFDQYLIEQVLF